MFRRPVRPRVCAFTYCTKYYLLFPASSTTSHVTSQQHPSPPTLPPGAGAVPSLPSAEDLSGQHRQMVLQQQQLLLNAPMPPVRIGNPIQLTRVLKL